MSVPQFTDVYAFCAFMLMPLKNALATLLLLRCASTLLTIVLACFCSSDLLVFKCVLS